jgi:hypothetical protein
LVIPWGSVGGKNGTAAGSRPRKYWRIRNDPHGIDLDLVELLAGERHDALALLDEPDERGLPVHASYLDDVVHLIEGDQGRVDVSNGRMARGRTALPMAAPMPTGPGSWEHLPPGVPV